MKKYNAEIVKTIIESIFLTAGCCAEEASTIASSLVESNLCGHDSHGIVRTSRYIDFLKSGKVFANQKAEIVFDGGSIISFDGKMGFGQSIGKQVMKVLIKRAHKYGIALSTIKGAGHLGRMGAWAEYLSSELIISLHFLNTTGIANMVTPFGGKDKRLSPSVFCVGIPGDKDEPVIYDITSAATAEGKLFVARNSNQPVPEGMIVTKNGTPTTDPNDFYDGGAILPFGEHKGSGLNIISDLLSGALSGGGCTAPGVSVLENTMTSIAIDLSVFPEKETILNEIKRFKNWVKSSTPVDRAKPVIFPGERSRNNRDDRTKNGIPIDEQTFLEICEAGKAVGLSDGKVHNLLAEAKK